MFPFPIAKPQKCDIQTFYATPDASGGFTKQGRSWNKPVGVSHVYMMLIGAGGTGASFVGGGSGAVTVWYGAAQHVPDSLLVYPGNRQGQDSVIYYRGNSLVPLLVGQSAGTSAGIPGSGSAAGPFAASGFYNSTTGQTGSNVDIPASSTTFLGAGSGSNGVGNYGYTIRNNECGFFQMQPIIVGLGSSSGSTSAAIGCGAGANGASIGGPGMVLIASW